MTLAPFLMSRDMVSGSGEISNSRAKTSIIFRLYMRMPEVGSVIVCFVARLMSGCNELGASASSTDSSATSLIAGSDDDIRILLLHGISHLADILRHVLTISIELNCCIVAMTIGIFHGSVKAEMTYSVFIMHYT